MKRASFAFNGRLCRIYLQQLFPPQQFISRYSMMMSQQSQPLSHPRHPPPQLSLHPPPQLSLHPPQQHISKRIHIMSLHPQLQVLNMAFSSVKYFSFARIICGSGARETAFIEESNLSFQEFFLSRFLSLRYFNGYPTL